MKITPLQPWIAGKIEAPADDFSRKWIEEYQLKRLRLVLQYVRQKSPFYQASLSAAPQHLSALKDLSLFPFTHPQDIRADPLRFVCVSQGDIQRVVTLQSSGTSGEPKRLYFTKEDQELTVDFFRVGMSTLVQPGDRVLILLPGERPGSVGDLLAEGLNRLAAHPIKHGPFTDAGRVLEQMRSQKVDSFVASPLQALALARHPQTGAGSRLALKSILLSTDHVPQAIVSILEAAWGCAVYNHYGMTEMGLGGGVECQARRGYHLREADLYIEIIDPVSGEPLPDGENGEVVFTTLTRFGMPLVRYRSGDISRFIPGPCPCGTVLKTLERIRYRASGVIHIPGGSITLADLDEALFPIQDLLDFSVSINVEDYLDVLRIDIISNGLPAAFAEHTVLDALEGLPALRDAKQNGSLRFRVTVQKVESAAYPMLRKRVIQDMR